MCNPRMERWRQEDLRDQLRVSGEGLSHFQPPTLQKTTNKHTYIYTYNDLPKFTQKTKKQADYKYLHVWVTTQLTINKSVWDKDVQGAW